MSSSSSTHQEPIDLEPIKARFNDRGNEYPQDYALTAVKDIPALIAEVEKLRAHLAEVEAVSVSPSELDAQIERLKQENAGLRKRYWAVVAASSKPVRLTTHLLDMFSLDCSVSEVYDCDTRSYQCAAFIGKERADWKQRAKQTQEADSRAVSPDTLEVIVNGQPVVLQAGTVRAVVASAIKQSGQIGAPIEQWELRTTEGDVIPFDVCDGTEYQLAPGRRLWLNLGLSKLLPASASRAVSGEPKWEPIETAPKDGSIIDVWLGEADTEEIEFYCTPGTRRSCGWTFKAGRFCPSMGLRLPIVTVRPTHWMPLPASPSAAVSEKDKE